MAHPCFAPQSFAFPAAGDLTQAQRRCQWKWQVLGVRCQVPGFRREKQVLRFAQDDKPGRVRCRVSGVRCRVSGARSRTYGTKWQIVWTYWAVRRGRRRGRESQETGFRNPDSGASERTLSTEETSENESYENSEKTEDPENSERTEATEEKLFLRSFLG